MDRIITYTCCSVTNTEFLVCHKESFNLIAPRSESSYTIPKYSYCHKVTINCEEKTAKCSCKERLSHGRPCVHVFKVLNNRIHGSMFHPRYFKIINSQLYETSPEIKSLYHQMVTSYWQDPNAVPLECVWKDLSFCSANPDGLFEGTTLVDKNRMIHLRKWNEEGKPFDRHSVTNIPLTCQNKYRRKM